MRPPVYRQGDDSQTVKVTWLYVAELVDTLGYLTADPGPRFFPFMVLSSVSSCAQTVALPSRPRMAPHLCAKYLSASDV